MVSGDSIEEILHSLEEVAGNEDEKLLAAGVFLEAMNEATEGIRIDPRGGIQEREGRLVEVMEGRASDAVNALWEDFGLAGLDSIELKATKQASSGNNNSRNPNRSRPSSKDWIHRERKHNRKRNFRTGRGVLPGAVGAIHDLILTGA